MRLSGWPARAGSLRVRAGLFVLASGVAFLFLAHHGRGSSRPTGTDTLRAAADRHHLLIGAAVDPDLLSDPNYASTLRTEYSVLEAENAMKFEPIHPEPDRYDFEPADKLVAFAEANGMKVRGHNLLWYRQVPGWVISPATPWTPAALNKVLADHIATVMGHYKGKVYAWDVVNEPFNDDGSMRSTIWYDKPGIGYAGQGVKMIEQTLRWAHAADPNAKLFVNEYGAEAMNAKSNAVYAMAKDFVKRGVPLSGIGLQLHVSTGFDQPGALDELNRNVKRLAALGLEVQFTEVDVDLQSGNAFSLGAEANTYKDLLKICLKQPQCTLFQTWGFTDKDSWISQSYPGHGWALPFDQNYGKKPAYHAMLKELEQQGNNGPRPLRSR